MTEPLKAAAFIEGRHFNNLPLPTRVFIQEQAREIVILKAALALAVGGVEEPSRVSIENLGGREPVSVSDKVMVHWQSPSRAWDGQIKVGLIDGRLIVQGVWALHIEPCTSSSFAIIPVTREETNL